MNQGKWTGKAGWAVLVAAAALTWAPPRAAAREVTNPAKGIEGAQAVFSDGQSAVGQLVPMTDGQRALKAEEIDGISVKAGAGAAALSGEQAGGQLRSVSRSLGVGGQSVTLTVQWKDGPGGAGLSGAKMTVAGQTALPPLDYMVPAGGASSGSGQTSLTLVIVSGGGNQGASVTIHSGGQAEFHAPQTGPVSGR